MVEYFKKPIAERLDMVLSAKWQTAPFFIERLQTAILKHNPAAVMMDEALVTEYFDLLNYKNSLHETSKAI